MGAAMTREFSYGIPFYTCQECGQNRREGKPCDHAMSRVEAISHFVGLEVAVESEFGGLPDSARLGMAELRTALRALGVSEEELEAHT